MDDVVAGIHREAAIRLLRRVPRPRVRLGPGGRPRAYGPEVAAAAEVLWQAASGAHRRPPAHAVRRLLAALGLAAEPSPGRPAPAT